MTECLEKHDDCIQILRARMLSGLRSIEALWKKTKCRLITAEYYEMLEDLKHAVSEYFRTC